MKRRPIHLAFGVLVLLSGAATLYEAAQLRRVVRINDAIDAMPARVRSRTDVASTGDAHEVVLARALALAGSGDTDGAAKTYTALIATARTDAAGRAALFDLGNLYLRQALRHSDENAAASVPMIELAKQRYRDLLKIDPDAWDARYNLERALRLAPELPLVFDDGTREPVDRRKAMAPDLLTPELP